MLFRFVTPTLPALDDLDSEVLVATLHSDVRPCRGVVGLCDFRMGGRLSRLCADGFVRGDMGEVVMVPGKPFLTFDKLLLFGAGKLADLDLSRVQELLHSFFQRLEKLRARAAVVELPGRALGTVGPGDVAKLMLREAQREWECDAWSLCEPPEGRSVIEGLVQEQRRRLRRGM